MKRFAFIFLLLFSCSLFGQYSNSWIDYSQKYYRIPITAEGIYRISYADLIANGISVGDFDHRNLQIIHNGEVLPLFVSAQSDGIFRNSDYFEFYAEGKNTGWLDSKVYFTGQPFNEDYSLYNDTASYFLTIANTLESPRYDTVRNTNYDDYTPISYCLRTVRSNYTAVFNETNSSSYIMPSEGWCDNYFDMGGSTQKSVITANYASVGVPSKISFGIGGFSETQHDIVVTLASDESIRYKNTYNDYEAIHKTLETYEPLNSSTTLTFQSIGAEDKTADKNSVSYMEVTYPCKLNFSNQSFFKFRVPVVENGDYILLDITNFNAGGSAPILYCPEKKLRLLTTVENGNYRVLIPNTRQELECVLLSQKAYSRVSEISPVQSKNSCATKFVNYTYEENEGDYIIVSEKSLWSEAMAYKSYRESTGQKVVLVDVEELYNQFAYGIRKHPYAISAFIEFALVNWSIKPEHIFLIGKGFHVPNFRNDNDLYARAFIPTMGNPASDLLFTMDVKGKSVRPNIAIGRLAAESPSDVAIYRKKVKDFESQEPSPWMKNVIHFGGGTTAIEQSTFRRYLTQYANSLKGEYFGADVHSFYKESSDVYETTEPAAIRKYMNEGTAMITFFGHASGSGFDQNIDHPSLFDNQGRYPFILANSCYSGDIFADNNYNVSKIWTFIEDKGSIGFLANVGTGVPNLLNTFSATFMRNIAYNNYGNSIGSSIAKTMNDLSNKNIVYEDLYDGIVGFTLQGDPIVKLHSFEKPDFEVDETSILFNQQVISTEQESFVMKVAVRNNGRAYSSSYSLRATFTPLNGGEDYVYETMVYGSYCKDTMSYVMDMSHFTSGEYTVTVEVDYTNSVEELSETNNSATVSFFVSTREVLPVYPNKDAIISTDTISVYMSSIDAFNPPTEVLIEIDTTYTYDSPLKQSAIVQTDGKSVVSWKPEGNFIDSTTYFWRVTSTDSIKWNESAFTYEKGKTGWGQMHSHQFVDNTLSSVNYDETTKSYSFKSVFHEISLKTKGNAMDKKDYYECLFAIDETMKENTGFPENAPALHVIVLDSLTLEPWLSSRANYGHRNYPEANGRERFYMAYSSNDNNAQNNMARLLLDTVPNGNYIFCYSYINPYCQSWSEELKAAMDSLGFEKYKTAPDDYPYIFYMQKGDTTSCVEIVGDSSRALISFRKDLSCLVDEASVKSQRIGPAKSYDKIVWNTIKHGKDYAYLSVYGNTIDEYSYTMSNLFSPEWDYLDSSINAKYYPYLQLSCYMRDTELRTAPTLDFWKVYFTPTAEFAITPQYAFSFYADSIQQGDDARIVISAQNVSESSSDSVLVLYEIRNAQNELVDVSYKRIRPIDAYAYVIDTQLFSTRNFAGDYTLKVEFNPVNPETGMYDQAEAIHFNNICYYNFTVTQDQISPILDVTVDGRHLVNGDNISAMPEIKISILDENVYFDVFPDTTLFTVSIVNVETNEIVSCHFADSTIVLSRGDEKSNMAIACCYPIFEKSGTYELQVQVRDVTGNVSASQSYDISFVVSFENEVSVLYNYPNPAINHTTFRFVLAGSEIPNNVSIELVNDKGEYISSIPVQLVHIGINNVEYDLSSLPNGMYFYHLSFDEKSSWKISTSKVTAPLNKNWGRLLIQH